MKALLWKVLSTREEYKTPIFSVHKVRARSRNTHKEKDFSVLKCPDWVNVIATTEDEKVLLIRQYRHGTREITIEIPGGVVEASETPVDAAKRELLEETGFSAGIFKPLGVVEPNPAFQENRTYTFLAEKIFRMSDPIPDETEEIECEWVPLEDIPRMIAQGHIRHSLVLCAFLHLYLDDNHG